MARVLLSKAMFKKFNLYFLIGIINTALHWAVFFIFYYFSNNQASSNLIAFIIAVSFSFYANAKWTFKKETNLKKYILYVSFLGFLAFTVGFVADYVKLYPLITQILFSGISLVCGFIYANFVVFRKCKN